MLVNIYYTSRSHQLAKWHEVCRWIESLPYAREFILSIGKKEDTEGSSAERAGQKG